MKILWPYIKDLYNLSRFKFVLNLLLMLLLGMMEGVGVLMIIPLLTVVGIIPGVQSDSLTAWVNNFFQSAGLPLSLPVILLIYVGLITGQGLLQRWQSILNFNIQQEYNVSLMIRLFTAVAYTDWQLLISKTKSDIANAIITELTRVYAGVNTFLQLLINVLITTIQVVIAFAVAPGLTLLVMAGAAVLFALMQKYVKDPREIGRNIIDLNNSLYYELTEHLNGIKEIKSYGVEAAQVENFSRVRRLMKKNMVDFNLIQTRTGLFYKVGAAVFISLFLYSAIDIFKLNPQEFIIITVIAARLWPRLSSFQQGLQNINMVLPSFQSVKELEEHCLAARENLPETEGGRMELKSGIEFRDVSFQYDSDRAGYAVQDACFVLPAGTTTAFVGASGAGKSTLVDILIGLLKPQKGAVFIDGAPLSENLRAWRNSIGYVPQDALLFNASIRKNLLWLCPDASEEEMWEALRLAAVDTFIRGLPGGLDTVVGDRGVRLSGGERQRIVLARALLRKPSVLILDEATSSLDSENEKRIQQAVENLRGVMTIVVIAHRISTIRNADRILVLEQGRIVETGDYQSLIKTGGRFQALASLFNDM